MILVSTVLIFRVTIVGIREVIAIAPPNRWSRHITSHNKPMAQGLQPHYRLIALNVPLACVVIVVILSQMVAVSSSGGNVAIGQSLVEI